MKIGKFIKKKRSKLPIEERFWEKVNKKSDDECWNWKGSKDGHGYGTIKYEEAMVKAHRMAWILKHENIPEGMEICHSCDNPSCCNVNHLFLGTQQDNIEDMVNKGRNTKGENCHLSKLTQDQVKKIRKKYINGITIKVLAKEFNMSYTDIYFIVNNKIWKDGKYEVFVRDRTGENHWNAKLTWEKVHQIRERYKKGESSAHLAEEFEVNRSYICNVIANKTWKEG